MGQATRQSPVALAYASLMTSLPHEVLHVGLQESKDNKGAWRTRQNASLLLELINNFFRTRLVQAMPHNLQEQDLAVPLHIDALQKLLAGNTTAVNQNFTPF